MHMKSLNQFTNLYQVSRTLRFELRPIGHTSKIFEQWLKEKDCTDNDSNMFAKDQHIKDAYLAIKPIMDKLHEQFIEKSLCSQMAKDIDFSEYFKAYRNKNAEEHEAGLRKDIGTTYNFAGEYFSKNISDAIGKEFKPRKPFECLTDAKILYYLSANVKALAKQNGVDEQTLDKHIKQFKGFWGYLGGYNQNRENYYEYEKEASTSVATRIVHENLPTFCDNALRFEKNREEYLNIYQYLKDNNRETKTKDSNGVEVEAEAINETIFLIKHFNECLAQSQIEEYNRIIGNYNYLINLYNQARHGENGFNNIDEFETLYKQIGCGKKKSIFEKLQNDSDLKKLLQKAKETGDSMFNSGCDELEINTVPAFIRFLKECNNWDGIYMSSAAINKISNLNFANWHSIKDRLKDAKANACITYDNKREDPIKLRDAVELSGLFAVLDKEQSEHFFKESLFNDDETNEYRGVLNKTLTPSQNLINLLCYDIEKNIKEFLENSDKIVALEKYKEENNQSGEEDKTIKQIKEWFDAATNAMRIVRYFAVRKSKMKGNIPNVTMEQALSNLLYSDDAQWFKWYDLVRNYLTKKPQDNAKENKLKLNFGKGNLLNGFVDSHTESDNGTQYGGYIFRKLNCRCNEYEYFLGISRNPKLFRSHLKDSIQEADKSRYERLEYYQMKSTTPYPNDYPELKRKIQDTVAELTTPVIEEQKQDSDKINKVGKDGNITPGQLFERLTASRYFKEVLSNDVLIALADKAICSIKENCKKYSKIESINNILRQDYCGLGGLRQLSIDLKSVTSCTKLFDFFPVSNKEFEDHTGKDLFLFKILNKDLSYCENYEEGKRKEKTNQKENLHTLFFRALMHEDGFGDSIDIGKGEIFYRKKAFEYDETTRQRGHHYELLKDKFKYPIISNKRFSEDKYLLHLSIILNYNSEGKDVSNKINESMQSVDNLHFIGIDRGEKHLVYSCTIDQYGKIVKCGHHDNINGTDYVQKLEAVADERIIAKKNWQAQNRIKDLKRGYLSHVVHRLVDETIKDGDTIAPHTYIVLEDLNTEMKRGRQKIEKQVYQNLELALAKKFNFVVDKKAKSGELGSVSNALQLTPPVNNYQDIEGRKRFGIMLYTRANYTSITDPATGWRKTIYIKNGKEEDIREDILKKFTEFGFDGKDYFFEYTEANAGHTWRLYSGSNGKALPRFQNKKDKLEDKYIWMPEQINVVTILDCLFENFDKKQSFKEQIIKQGVELKKVEERKETAWQSLRYALNLIQQIRNSGLKKEDDNFLFSPVRNKNGEHFDTRNYQNNGDLSEIKDADANGAFNIARKGLIMDAHIKHWIEIGRPMKSMKKDAKTSDLDLFISDKEWDLWLLDRKQWKKELPTFASLSAKEGNTKSQTRKRSMKEND